MSSTDTFSPYISQSYSLIFLDMDGVIANYEKMIFELYEKHVVANTKGDWWAESIFKHKIFENLELMPGAEKLIDVVLNSGLDVEILSSAGWGPTRDEACRQKRTWLENHDLGYLPVTFTTNKLEKSNYALASSILIDDHLECINPFIDKGGCGILHKDADTTINTLNSILFATRRYA